MKVIKAAETASDNSNRLKILNQMPLQNNYTSRLMMIAIVTGSLSSTGCLSGPFHSKNFGVSQNSPAITPLLTPPENNPSFDRYLPKTTTEDRAVTKTAEGKQLSHKASTTDHQHIGQTHPPTPPSNDVVFRAQSQDSGNAYGMGQASVIPTQGDPQSGVQQATAQYPELNTAPAGSIFNPGTINTGAPNEASPLVQMDPMVGVANFPNNYADLDIYVSETQTGKINFGGAYNSENGIVGQFVIDERNFDIWAFPRNFRQLTDGNAWRGAGQTFRLEIVPGREVQRYLVSFAEPYLFNTGVSFSASAYLFDRNYYDWDEQRLGGRLALGYRLTQDLSLSTGLRMENVKVYDPRLDTSPELNDAVGETDMFIGHVGLIRDTRDHPFMATEGSYFSMTFNQGFGEYDFSRGDFDFRKYMLMYQRPDGSGRHTVTLGSRLGFTGSQTPIFENYFAGGFSTMRGFDFRGASPVQNGVVVGGEFQWLNTVEYMFPLTADDMVKGVVFCDFGTVEENIQISADTFRVAPGFGFRVHMPAAGIGAPLAFDFAFPVAKAATDQEQTFSFYLGVLR